MSGRSVEPVHTVTIIHCHTVTSLPCGLCFVFCHPVWILLCYCAHSGPSTMSVTVTAGLRISPAPAHALSLLPLETVYRVLQCVSASCDWLLTSVEALPHREVTLVLSPSPCMHVSLLYQTRSLEDQLQLQGAANRQHRYSVYWFTLTWPIVVTC